MTQLMNRLVKKVMLLMTKAEFEKNWSGSVSRSVQWTFMEPHLVMVMLSTMMIDDHTLSTLNSVLHPPSLIFHNLAFFRFTMLHST